MLTVRLISPSSRYFASSSSSFLHWGYRSQKPLLSYLPYVCEGLLGLHTTVPASKTNRNPSSYRTTTDKNHAPPDNSFPAQVAYQGIMLLAGNLLKRNKITLSDLKQLEVEMRDADPQQRKTGAKFFTTADCHLLSPAARKTYDAISKCGKFIGAPLLMTLQYPSFGGMLLIAELVYMVVLAIMVPIYFWTRTHSEDISTGSVTGPMLTDKIIRNVMEAPIERNNSRPTGYYDDFSDSKRQDTKISTKW